MKVTLSEINKNIQGTNSEGEETRIQIRSLEQKGKINIHPEQKEETRIQRNDDSIRSLWDISKHISIQIIEMPVREQEEKEIENLLEKITKENFPNLGKEIDIQVQEAQRVPNKMGPKCSIIIKAHHN